MTTMSFATLYVVYIKQEECSTTVMRIVRKHTSSNFLHIKLVTIHSSENSTSS